MIELSELYSKRKRRFKPGDKAIIAFRFPNNEPFAGRIEHGLPIGTIVKIQLIPKVTIHDFWAHDYCVRDVNNLHILWSVLDAELQAIGESNG